MELDSSLEPEQIIIFNAILVSFTVIFELYHHPPDNKVILECFQELLMILRIYYINITEFVSVMTMFTN